MTYHSSMGQISIQPPAQMTALLPPCVPQEVKTWAQEQCIAVSPHGLGQLMPTIQLNPYNFNWASVPACQVAALPVCAPPAARTTVPVTPPPAEPEEPADKSETSGLVIGGIILLALIGGGYVYYKTRKQ